MTRDEAIAQLEGLQAELAASEIEAKLYLPIGAQPELVWPWLHGLKVRLWWARGIRLEDGWRVKLTDWGKDTTEDFAVHGTIAECVEWLAGRGQ